jgi:predicted transposase YbfD/YdcC
LPWDGKTNEITMFTALLSQAGDLTGVLVTADALHAQREHATWLHERGADYLVTVKGNQPGLLAQLRSLPWKDVPAGHVQDGRGHGRLEKRIIKAVTVAAGLAGRWQASATRSFRVRCGAARQEALARPGPPVCFLWQHGWDNRRACLAEMAARLCR